MFNGSFFVQWNDIIAKNRKHIPANNGGNTSIINLAKTSPLFFCFI